MRRRPTRRRPSRTAGLAAAGLTLLLTACVAGAGAAAVATAGFALADPPGPDEALLYLYWPTTSDAQGTVSLMLDGDPVAEVAAGEYAVVRTTPGEHEVGLRGPTTTSITVSQLAPASSTFVRYAEPVDLGGGRMMQATRWAQAYEQARDEIARCRPAASP